MNAYATLDELKRFMGREEILVEDFDDRRIADFCVRASRVFDLYCTNGFDYERFFYPKIATYYYDHPVSAYAPAGGGRDSLSPLTSVGGSDASRLFLGRDLLELTALTTNNGGVNVSTSDVLLTSAQHGRRITPGQYLQLKRNGTTTAFSFSTEPYEANAVTGVWGYHTRWSDAWESSGDTVQDVSGIDASVTTITVADADGDGIYGYLPRFERLQTIKIDEEYILVTKVDTTANTLTVVRGINGSTAATHANDAAIYIYRPMAELRDAIEILALYMFRRKDSIGSDTERTIVTQRGVMMTPQTLPGEVTERLSILMKESL